MRFIPGSCRGIFDQFASRRAGKTHPLSLSARRMREDE
ncbi:hypothetical protein CSC04_0286 [Enterobacter roggenkampii]|nr:hypothetical protein CSC04_0286 [Enterobacter roggenkampii]